ncbi:MAG: TetR family transcriptional regulator [Candidatus Acidiferrales bacterium]
MAKQLISQDKVAIEHQAELPAPAGKRSKRRSPVQERSQETVQRIFRSASQLLSTAPIDEITTSRIAHAAGLSIGALYRFFPDKQSIIDAIAVRHMHEFRAAFESKLTSLNFSDGPAFLSTVIDAFVAFLESRPDFRAIAFGQISAATRQHQADPNASGAGLVKRFMIESLGMNDLASLDLKLCMAIETGERLFAYAFEQPDAPVRAAVIAELKNLLASYLFPSPR